MRMGSRTDGDASSGVCRLLLAAVILTLSRTADAQPLQTIVPRDSTDWTVSFVNGPCTASVEVSYHPEQTNDPTWTIRLDAVEGLSDQLITLDLPLSRFGISPQTSEQAEHWTWRWYVRNMETADFVTMGLLLESGPMIHLATSHSLYDYVKDYVQPPVHYSQAWSTVSEALKFRRDTFEPYPDSLGRITAVRLSLASPHDQEVWIGPISFGPAREKAVAFPRAEITRTTPGKFLVTDLDGDGVTEVLTPWTPGGKVWKYDRNRRVLIRSDRRDELGTSRLFHHLVAGDIDGDGDNDLVALGSDEETLHLLMNRRDGFHGDTLRVRLPEPGAKVTSMALADDDGDQRLELFLGYHLMSNPNLGRIFRLPGLPGPRFGPAMPLPTTFNPRFWGTYQIALADLDGDGILDLVAGAAGIGVHVFPGHGGGQYGESVLVERMYQNGHLRAITLGDADGDGDLDIYIAMENTSGGPNRTGQNYLCLNDGAFVFRDVAMQWGVTGGPLTEDACFAEINGVPGPELVVLEGQQVVAYDLRSIAAAVARGGPPPPESARILVDDPALVSGAMMFSCQDLDADGAVELLLSREDGPLVVRMPGTGPVRRVRVAGLGMGAEGIGSHLRGRGDVPWSLPLMSTNRIGPCPVLVAVEEQVGLDSSAVPAGAWTAGSLQTLDAGDAGGRRSRFEAASRWMRFRAPRLWEYPWQVASVPEVQSGFGIVLILVAGGSFVAARRSAARRTEVQSWRDLLAAVGISSHAAWRTSVSHLLRCVRQLRDDAASVPGARLADGDVERLREHLPPELLRKLEQAMAIAASLRLEGSRTARAALRGLSRLHQDGSPDLDALQSSGHALITSLSLIQRTLAEQFSCDASEVYRRTLLYRLRKGFDGGRVSWECEDESLARRFPLSPEDCFACLDELLANAEKKTPVPDRIRVRALPRGPRGATLRVWDDGASVDAERARPGRAGDHSGLRRLNEMLAPYGGQALVENAPGGGVNAEIRVPRFDLD